ncbi:MAG: class I SAM-dependent methyltransferase, partial [Chloroflexota bacterium]
SPEMLRRAQHRISQGAFERDITLLLGRAEDLAFADECFDAVCFTYLLRYVDDPESTLREIVRVLKPGGSLVSLEFGVPRNIVVRGLWYAYTRGALPLMVRAVSPGWRRVGTFLGPSISEFYRAHPIDQIQRMWVKAGISDVRTKRLSLGGGVVMWGTKVRGAKTPNLGGC